MPDIEKIVSAVLRTVATALIGGTSYQLFDGRWFGETIFTTFLQQQTLGLLTHPANTDLYGMFAAQSVPQAMQNASPVLVFVSLVLLLLLFAHVVSKPAAAKARATLPATPAPGRLRTAADRKAFANFVKGIYIRYHEAWTVCTFFLMISLFFFWPFRGGLALAFLLITIPSAYYLIVYATDITRGEFAERFVYVCVFVFLVAAIVAWPRLYAQRQFDPDFTLATPNETFRDHCDRELSKGPTFVAFEKGDEQLLFRLCVDLNSGRKFLDFFVAKDAELTKRGATNLRTALEAFSLPETPR